MLLLELEVVVVEVVEVVEVVVEVVRVEPIHMEPRIVGIHSTCAIYQGRSSVVQYMEDSSMVGVHIMVPLLVAGAVDNGNWDARQTCPISETIHC